MISSRPAPPPQLSRYVTEIPQNIAAEQGRKAVLYSLASKVCFVAMIAICAVLLSINMGLLPPLSPALAFGMILSALPIWVGIHSYSMRSLECSTKANIADEKAQEFASIQHWAKPQVEEFFKKHNLSVEKLPMDLLRRLNPKDPLRALLPAIASYNHLCNSARKHFQKHEENLYNRIENPALHYLGRREGWHILEYEAIPEALQAALVLQIIGNPTIQSNLEDLGTCQAKEFDQRRFDQLLDGNDDCFVFKDENRTHLTFGAVQQMVAKRDFDGLRLKLFS
jgi:hypothetical protein